MAAGLGFKTFTTGEVLTAADTNGYLMQGVLVFASSAARSAAITSPQEGQMSYLKDTNSTEYYTGSAWTALGTAAPSFSLLNSGGTSLTGATVTISGISGISTLWVNITEASLDAGSNQIYVRFNGVTSGSLYDVSGMRNQAPTAYSTAVIGSTSSGTGGGDEWAIATMSSNAASVIRGGLMVFGCNSSGTKVGHFMTGSNAAGGNTAISLGEVASFRSSSTISSISFTASAGNFDAGTVYVYGSA